MKFEKGSFDVATYNGVVETRTGWATPDLGLHRVSRHWIITHLNTGFIVMKFSRVAEARALEIADKVAAIDCWDFVGIEGWRNRDPDLPRKIERIYSEVEQHRFLNDKAEASDTQKRHAASVLAKREAR